jgi:twitching motility protein PilT
LTPRNARPYVPPGRSSFRAGVEGTISQDEQNPLTIDELLRYMVQQDASDLHLKPMRPPLLRIKGKLLPLKMESLQPDRLREMLGGLLNDRLKKQLEDNCAIDFGHSVPGVSRFRASVFLQRGTLCAVFRRVPFAFPSLEDWGLPPILAELAKLPQGLVLITGPTGSGKSSTLAAMIRMIIDTRLVHVVTIEDPIEFLLNDNLGAVTQREVGTDTPGFAAALRNALRQDPDVIMVGETRDLPTIQTVLTAAETGHLVFSTVHTNGAAQTIDRIIDQFPEGNHRQIRQQLASVLQAIISLKLVERSDGGGLIAAVEILRQSPRVSKLILEGNLEALEEELESSVSYYKMQSMTQSLAALVLRGVVSRDTAIGISSRPGDLDLMLRKFLYASDAAAAEHGETMAEPLSDFSKILELQEVKKLYDELQDRYRQDVKDRDEEIARLRTAQYQLEAKDSGAETETLRAEVERLGKQAQLIRQEYEAKIERLNARLRETAQAAASAPAPGAEPGKGFFRR